MKSYSDDIPNISTDEIKKSVETSNETNSLVKDNLEEIKNLHTRAKALNVKYEKKMSLIITILFLILFSTGAILITALLTIFNLINL